LPREVKDLFRDWLAQHYPLRAAHVMSLVQQVRGGRDYDSTFGVRQRGEGLFADLIAKRFALACKRLKLNEDRTLYLDTTRFRPPGARAASGQLDLFA
jgi:DNA repair photolyase